MTIYECLHDVINRGDYNVSDMEHKIDGWHVVDANGSILGTF